MTALASRFTISGDVRCFAGEALTVELAFDTAGSLVDLTGREWAWTVYRANDREPLFSAAGEVVSVGDDHFVRFAIDGDTTDELFARNRIGLRHEMAEVTAGGRDVWVEGQFSIARSAAAVSPAPVSATAGSATRYVFDYQTRRVTISPRGAPGLPIWQALGLTEEQYRAEQAQAGADAGEAAGAAAGAAAGETAGQAAGASAGAAAGGPAGATAGADAVQPSITAANSAASNADTKAKYAGDQGDYAKAQGQAIGDISAAVTTTGLNKTAAQTAEANATRSATSVGKSLTGFRDYRGSSASPLFASIGPDGSRRTALGWLRGAGAFLFSAPIRGAGFTSSVAATPAVQAAARGQRDYTGSALSIPLITLGRRLALGLSRLTGEPTWMGKVWPVPSSGPMRDALGRFRDFTGGTGRTPLVTLGRREAISMSNADQSPLWMGQPWPGAAGATTTSLPHADRPRLLGASSIHALIAYGQSLSVGDEARGVISTTQPYANLMLNGGLKTGDVANGMTSLVPLIEQMQAAGGAASTTSGETIVSSAANASVKLAIQGGDISRPAEWVHVGGAPGLGSQSIAQLSKGTAPYNRLLAQVQGAFNLAKVQAKAYTVDVLPWIQGEQDAELGTTRAAYLAALLQLRADLDADIKAITGQANSLRVLLYQTSHKIVASGGAVALAQMDAVRTSPFFHFATPCWPFPRYDFVHLKAEGYNWMGRYFGRAIHQLVAKGRVPDCLRPVSAFVVAGGTALTIRFLVPQKPLVLDTTLGSPKDFGIRVTDDTGDLTLTGIAVSGETMTMTLSRALAANPRFRIGLDYPGTDNGRGTHCLRDSTGDIALIAGTTYKLWHISAADELAITNLEA